MNKLDDLPLSNGERAAIEEAARRLRVTYPVKSIILFGSKSRGDDDPESDIDLLVLTSRHLTRAERHEISDVLFPIQLQHDVVLGPVIVQAEDWESGLISVSHPRRSGRARSPCVTRDEAAAQVARYWMEKAHEALASAHTACRIPVRSESERRYENSRDRSTRPHLPSHRCGPDG